MVLLLNLIYFLNLIFYLYEIIWLFCKNDQKSYLYDYFIIHFGENAIYSIKFPLNCNL